MVVKRSSCSREASPSAPSGAQVLTMTRSASASRICSWDRGTKISSVVSGAPSGRGMPMSAMISPMKESEEYRRAVSSPAKRSSEYVASGSWARIASPTAAARAS